MVRLDAAITNKGMKAIWIYGIKAPIHNATLNSPSVANDVDPGEIYDLGQMEIFFAKSLQPFRKNIPLVRALTNDRVLTLVFLGDIS